MHHTLNVVASAFGPCLQAILGAPLGMTRLMDLLGEQEVLRNEALLLLTQVGAGCWVLVGGGAGGAV